MCMFVSLTLTAEIWSYATLRLRCMTIELSESPLRKESAIKNCHKFFSKKYTSSLKDIKWTEVSWQVWEVHSLYVFRSQQDKKNFRSATLVLLYQVNLRDRPLENLWGGGGGTKKKYSRKGKLNEKKSYKEFDEEKKFLRLENSPPPSNFSNGPSLNIARRNGYAKQNIILAFCCIFLANKPRHKLSGIRRKEKKNVCTQGNIRENSTSRTSCKQRNTAELSPARQSIAGNHHIHSKYVLW